MGCLEKTISTGMWRVMKKHHLIIKNKGKNEIII